MIKKQNKREKETQNGKICGNKILIEATTTTKKKRKKNTQKE